MQFDPPLVQGRLIRRYKRFFADVLLDSGERVVAHCPNTGAMTGCLRQGAPVALARADNPRRKLAWTWVMVFVRGRWVVVDTGRSVPMVREIVGHEELLPELAGYERSITEVKYGARGSSRIDLLLSRGGQRVPGQRVPVGRRLHEGDERVYIEVKATTLVLDETVGSRTTKVAAFPDAVTERGQKHLRELMLVVEQGHRAAMVYVVQRSDARRFRPADEIDPEYGRQLRLAARAGVELYALGASVGRRRLRLARRLPIDL